jgi:hypothetical protein
MSYVVTRTLDAVLATKHPVRAAVLDVETYHDSVGKAVRELSDALADYGLRFDSAELDGLVGDADYRILAVLEGGDDAVGYVNFSWYTLENGVVEINAYVA